MANVLYTASATAHGGRSGKVTSENGQLNLDLVAPKELGGPGGVGTDPEQLFAAGYAACFMSALSLVGRRAKVTLADATVTGEVSLSRNSAGGFELGVNLIVALPGVDREVANQLIAQAHQVCPYSNATRGNIEVGLVLADEVASS
jgi:Ohr subfamily peroxiredoxin